MTGYTAGPWTVKDTVDANDMTDMECLGVYATSDLEQCEEMEECPSAIAFINDNWGEYEANARLISVAPVMLKELRKCAEVLRVIASLQSDKEVKKEMREQYTSAFAIIAKAEGTEP